MTYRDDCLRSPLHDCHETWRAQRTGRHKAAMREQRGHERDHRHIAVPLVPDMMTAGEPAANAGALVMAN